MLTPTFRPGSTEHDILGRVKRRSDIGSDASRRRALATLVDWGLVTAGSPNELTAEGAKALARLDGGGTYTPRLGQDRKAARDAEG